MVPVVINTAIQLPMHLINFTLRKLRLIPAGAAGHHTFPVAGLDEGRAHAVLYALRQAATDTQVCTSINRQFCSSALEGKTG